MNAALLLLALSSSVLLPTARCSPFLVADFFSYGNATAENPLADIVDEFVGLGQDFGAIFQNLSEAGADYSENVRNLTIQFEEEVEQYFQALGESVRQHLHNTFTAFAEQLAAAHQSLANYMTQLRSAVKRQALTEADYVVQQVTTGAKHLQQLLLTLRIRVSEQIREQEATIMDAWSTWATQQVQKIGEALGDDYIEVRQTAEGLVSDMISRHTETLLRCSEKCLIQELQFEESVQDTIDKYEPRVQLLLDEAVACVEGSDGILATQRCRYKVQQHVSQLNAATDDFRRLTESALGMIGETYALRSCARTSFESFDLERVQVELHLEILVMRALMEETPKANEDSSSTTEGTSAESDSEASSSDESSSEGSTSEDDSEDDD